MKTIGVAAVSILLLASNTTASTKLIHLGQWEVEDGGNGHWYGVYLNGHPFARGPYFFRGDPLSWTDANEHAAATGGYLASVTSEAENEFVFALSDDDALWHKSMGRQWGPWLGASQPQDGDSLDSGPADRWRWVTGEPFEFASWFPGEPNDFAVPEDALEYYSDSYDYRSAFWNDAPRIPEGLQSPFSYVVEFEFDPRPVPEPSSALVALSILGLGVARHLGAKHRRNRID